jgi:regulator of cell morphogenesis and NO signaling
MKRDITIGEIVAADYRAAQVFKEAGIDFCCGGKKSIDETCYERDQQ